MGKISILMTMKNLTKIGGHTTVIKNICKRLENLDYEIVLGAQNFEYIPKEIPTIKLRKFGDISVNDEYEFDIIHNHQTIMNWYSLFSKKPFIFHWHGTSSLFQTQNFKLSLSICKKNINQMICVSESSFNWSKNMIGNIDTTVIHNGVDSKKFKDLKENNEKVGSPQLLFVGNLLSHKDIPRLIYLTKSLVEKFPNLHLMIVGEGEEKENIKNKIYELKLEKNIELLGKLEDDELVEVYSSCDIYVSASRLEAGPLTPIEALSCGKPIVLSKIPQHEEIVMRSNAGKVFDDNQKDYVEKIEEVYNRREELGKIGRKFAEANDWDIVCKKIGSVYHKLLKK